MWEAGVNTLVYMLREQVPYEVLIKVVHTRFGTFAPNASAANPQVATQSTGTPSAILLEAAVRRLVQLVEGTSLIEKRYEQQLAQGIVAVVFVCLRAASWSWC
jgi:hypothetical protein